MDAQAAANLARNIRHLREVRGLTQQRLANLSGVPRAAWAHLGSGGSMVFEYEYWLIGTGVVERE